MSENSSIPRSHDSKPSAKPLRQLSATGLDSVTAEGAIGINGSSGLRFEDWIDGALAEDQPRGFNADADGDGESNSLERFFGRNPGASDEGGMALVVDGAGRVLRHTRTSDPGPDVSAHYEWSPNLINWLASGASFGSTSVLMNPVVVADNGSSGKLVEVTPLVAGEAPRLFFRLRLDQDSSVPAAPGPLTAPSITTGPNSMQDLQGGESLTLTVTVVGTGPIFFQWLKDDVEIAGADEATLFIPAVSSADMGLYRVRVTGVAGSILSLPYEVNVTSGGGF